MEAIWLGFLLAALNGLEVCAANIGNDFLYGKTNERVYIVAGPKFGDACGKQLIIDKGLYGLRSSSARFHEHLSAKLRKLGYHPSKADPDFWLKDCGTHYKYIAAYVDDIFIFSKTPMSVIDELKKDYILKGIGLPMYYLGGNVVQLDQRRKEIGVQTALSAETYIANVVKKFEETFGGKFRKFKAPMDNNYHP